MFEVGEGDKSLQLQRFLQFVPVTGSRVRWHVPVIQVTGRLRAHKRFSELLSKEDRNLTSVPMEKVLSLPELKSKPFRKRICHVFSTSDMKDGSLTFEDFLDLLSAFSDSATLEIKSHYAFCIFDFDDDGTLDGGDLEKLVNCLTDS
ncbi:calcium and integrin-binding protein 1-like isoform X1 [Oncorhynchus keta]|uniref:calcium and integrin-binding protein 1-like isoform X1 n=1 Tax=Oncorhynchus keta TaxID=8018 RepID=UPI0015F9E81A|nr:calcium and integrin-binding protein 1-like isoform X1 [Oncorhynchus keta]